MTGVPIYSADADDFSGNGLGLLLPSECTVEETAGGMYNLRLVQPITNDLRWSLIANGCIIKAAVPVRESPIYESSAASGGTTTTTITRKIYKVRTNGSRLHLRQKPSTSSKILSKWKPGTEVVQLNDEGNGWYHVSIVNGGATGYMYANWLRYDRDVTETITSTTPGASQQGVKVQPARDQLFRVQSVETDTDAGTVTATAMHIFYDLRGNIVNGDYAPEDAPAAEAAAHIFANALNPHDFTIHTPNLTGTVTADYGYRPIVEDLLDPDDGIVPQAKALLVRDNYDVFLLPDEVRDMGVTVRRGKNLIGVTVTHDESNVVTRIVPVGTDKPDKDGNTKPLYLADTIYVDSARINDYPAIYAKKIEYDVSVVAKKGDANPDEGKYATAEEARAELKKRAEAEFEDGCDLPSYGMEVDFILLGNTAEYSQYAGLQSVHLFDTVTVIDKLINLTAKLRATGYVWDVLAEQYQSVTLGDIQELTQTVYSYNLPTGGISGTKIASNTMSGNVFRDLTIGYAKIAVAAIEQLAANSITAISAHINDLVAGKIEANQLYADLAAIAVAEITTANINKANINWAEIKNLTAEIANIVEMNVDWANIDTLNAKIADIALAKIQDAEITTAQISDLQAEIAKIITLAAQDGKFDFASIKDLLAQAMIIEEGVAGSVTIKNLVATQANILGATLGELVLQGADGNYYNITVRSDGTISTERVTLTSGEISAGQTSGGKQIVATTANVDALNATDIKAQSAIISSIFTGALQAGKISAQEAFLASATIPELRVTALKALGDTLDISANEQIRLLAGELAQLQVDQDSIRAEVSNRTVGGTQLIKGTSNTAAIVTTYTTQSGATVSKYAYGDDYPDKWLRFSVVNGTFARIYVPSVAVIVGRTYTFSAEVAQYGNGFRIGAGDAHGWTNVAAQSKGATRVSNTFTATTDTVNLCIDMTVTSSTNNYMDVRKLKLESGNTATDWTPHPLDPVEWLKTSYIEILKDAITLMSGGSINIEAGATLAVLAAKMQLITEDFVLALGSEDNMALTVENDTSSPYYGYLRARGLLADNHRPYISSATYKSSEIGGMQGFADLLAANTYGYVELVVDQAEYGTSFVTLYNVFAGRVIIKASSMSTNMRPLSFDRVSATVTLENLMWDCAGSTALMMNSGVYRIVNCWIKSANLGLAVDNGAMAAWYSTDGGDAGGYCSDFFSRSIYGSRFQAEGNIPGSARHASMGDCWRAYGGSYTDLGVTVKSSGSTSTSTYQSTTLTATIGWRSNSQNSWHSGVMYQGYSKGKGWIRGCMKFTLPSMTTLQSATLTLHRVSGAGKGAPVDIKVYSSTATWQSLPSTDSLTLRASRDDAVLGGQSVSIDVTSAVSALRSGATQLVLFTGEGSTLGSHEYSSNYAKFDSATLEITYR